MKAVFPIPTTKGNSKIFPKYAYAQRGLQINVERIIEYARVNRPKVNSDFIIAKLLDILPPTQGLTPERYYDNIELDSNDFAKSVGISTSTNIGRIYTNEFYGKDSVEIIVSAPLKKPEFDDLGNLKDWKDVEPINILYYPSSDVNLDIPHGKDNFDVDGFSVIVIDVALLGVQYSQWSLSVSSKPLEQRPSKYDFIYSYPLTNLLKSQLNVSIFNRLSNIYNETPLNASTGRSVVPIVDYSSEVDKGLQSVIETIEKDNLNIDEMLNRIPLGLGYHLRDILPLLDIFQSKQVYWVTLAAFEPYLDFIIKINLVTGQRGNRSITNKLKKEINRVFRDKLLNVCPHIGLREYLMYQYKNFLELL